MAKGRKADKTGRSRGDKFVMLRQGLRETDAWRSLSFAARCVLIEMMAGVHEANNGRVPRSVRFLADVVGASRSTVEAALRDLQGRGFIERTQGGFLGSEGHAQAALWRVTEIGTMEERRPTKDYLNWREPDFKSLSQKSGRSVPKIGTVAPKGVPKNRTGCPENRDGNGGFERPRCPEKQDESIIPGSRGEPPDLSPITEPGFGLCPLLARAAA